MYSVGINFVGHSCTAQLHLCVSLSLTDSGMYIHVSVYMHTHRDHAADVLFDEDSEDQSLPLCILESLLKVHWCTYYFSQYL